MRCLVMFSGGLDSVIAAHLLMQQGIDVLAVHFVLPFESGLGRKHSAVKKYAQSLGVELRIEEEGAEFLEMVKDPHFGYGKHANPCIDCRINRIAKAAAIMEQENAKFIATGEVVGQRPMSQRKDRMLAVEKRSGIKGYLLRPLSAKLLDPTVPENEGWVDRGKLLAISGRGRREQLAYAKHYGLMHSAPAGGCILTQEETGSRFNDLCKYNPDFILSDFKLLGYGRHFRINDACRLIVGRDKYENDILAQLVGPGDWLLRMAGMEGPFAIARGQVAPAALEVCARIVSRYSRARASDQASVRAMHANESTIVDVMPAGDDICDKLRIRYSSGKDISLS